MGGNTLRELEVGDTPGEPGIHLSYMAMNRNEIKTKYESFSHTELNKPKFFQQSLIDICDKYAISHLGDAEKPGFGLLFEVQPKDFSNVQKKILKLNPHWIEQKPKNVSKLSRFYRSILISMYFVDSNSKNLPLHGLKKQTYHHYS